MTHYLPVLSIAGSDSSGGAGIQADIKTISALGCYGMTAITAITAQNTMGVDAIQAIDPKIVAAQIDSVYADIPPLAVKTGMLFNSEIIAAVADRLAWHGAKNLVVDPVMVSTSGSQLLASDAIDQLVGKLFPLSLIVTPNKHEARLLAQSDLVDDQIKALRSMGCRYILLKGGDTDDTDVKTDYLVTETGEVEILKAKAIDTPNTHGTGCTLSSAIASYLAMGYDVVSAVKLAKTYITNAIEQGANVAIGRGHGPVNHFFDPQKLKRYEDNNK